MINITLRSLSDIEKAILIKRMPTLYKQIESLILKFIFIELVFIIPLLIYDHFSPIASNTQGIYCIIVTMLSILISILITIKWQGGFSNKKLIENLNSLEIEDIHIKTNRALKREDPEDFGIAFYLEIFENSEPKTLYLWGQYLDMLEYEKLFPNTEFKFIRKPGSDEFIDFKVLGSYFKEEKTLPPFDDDIFKSGKYPTNGQIFDFKIDEIKQ